MEWKPLQMKTEGLELTDLLDDDFINHLKLEFENKRISVTNIQFSVMDKEVDENNEDTVDLITLWNKNFKEDLLKKVIVDVNKEENLNKIMSALNKIDD